MQSIRICLGKVGKADVDGKSIEKIRKAFLKMTKIPISIGDLKVEGSLYSVQLGRERNHIYLECGFHSIEED